MIGDRAVGSRGGCVRRAATALASVVTAVGVLVSALGGSAGAVAAAAPPADSQPSSQRPQLVDLPVGCQYEPFDDSLVIFVGTVSADDYRTIRYRVDQVRAGDMNRYGSQVTNPDGTSETLVDVRYAIDTKYLDVGRQYLVAARFDAQQNLLVSKVSAREAAIGSDEIIGSSESQLDCPEIDDPVMTLSTDGSSVESGMLKPLTDDKPRLLAALLVPAAALIGALALLALVKWAVTSIGASSSAARERRRNRSRRPASPSARPAMTAGGPTPAIGATVDPRARRGRRPR